MVSTGSLGSCGKPASGPEIGYKRRSFKGGKPAVVADNRLNRQFTVHAPDRAWVTDITYIRTYEGWTYLAVAALGGCLCGGCGLPAPIRSPYPFYLT